jgi:hypothetical protein
MTQALYAHMNKRNKTQKKLKKKKPAEVILRGEMGSEGE